MNLQVPAEFSGTDVPSWLQEAELITLSTHKLKTSSENPEMILCYVRSCNYNKTSLLM